MKSLIPNLLLLPQLALSSTWCFQDVYVAPCHVDRTNCLRGQEVLLGVFLRENFAQTTPLTGLMTELALNGISGWNAASIVEFAELTAGSFRIAKTIRHMPVFDAIKLPRVRHLISYRHSGMEWHKAQQSVVDDAHHPQSLYAFPLETMKQVTEDRIKCLRVMISQPENGLMGIRMEAIPDPVTMDIRAQNRFDMEATAAASKLNTKSIQPKDMSDLNEFMSFYRYGLFISPNKTEEEVRRILSNPLKLTLTEIARISDDHRRGQFVFSLSDEDVSDISDDDDV